MGTGDFEAIIFKTSFPFNGNKMVPFCIAKLKLFGHFYISVHREFAWKACV